MKRAGQKQQVSIRDVARASGVSLTTVSLVLNKGDERISQATRERVQQAIRELGYRPNRLAQGLQNRRSHILAVLVPQLTHTFADVYFGELISGIYDEASTAGYKILLEAAGPEFVERKRYLDLFDRCFIDGLLFMGSHDGHTFVHDLTDPERPFILVNNVMPGLDFVVCDYREAGRLAARHLLDLGHRRVGMIRGPVSVQTAREIMEGFAGELARRGVELTSERIAHGHYTEQGGADAVDSLFARDPTLTALFAGNDKMAIGAMQRLLAMGRRVPGDVSIVGCDDIHQAAFVTPALTTIHTPLYDTGRLCCRRIIDRIRKKAGPCREILPVELRLRHSTAGVSSPI